MRDSCVAALILYVRPVVISRALAAEGMHALLVAGEVDGRCCATAVDDNHSVAALILVVHDVYALVGDELLLCAFYDDIIILAPV